MQQYFLIFFCQLDTSVMETYRSREAPQPSKDKATRFSLVPAGSLAGWEATAKPRRETALWHWEAGTQ